MRLGLTDAVLRLCITAAEALRALLCPDRPEDADPLDAKREQLKQRSWTYGADWSGRSRT